jgi:hypothetical protein
VPALLPLDDRLETAAQLAKRARIFYEIWWYYEGAQTRSQILDTMQAYSEFFRFEPHAHFVSAVTYLAGLYESRGNTINLSQLIREAEAAGVDKAAIDKAQGLMTASAGLVSKVMILRSNLFAHRSASLSYEDVFRKAELKPDQLGELADTALNVANTLLLARGLDEQFSHELSRRAVERMMIDLARLRR